MPIPPYVIDSIVFLCPPAVLWWYLRQRRERAARREADLALQSWKRGCDLIEQAEWQDALSCFSEAESLLDQQPEMASRLHLYRGYAMEQLGEIEPALEEYELLNQSGLGDADQLYCQLGTFRRARLLIALERSDEAEPILEQVIAEAMPAGWYELWLGALRTLLRIYHEQGRFAELLQRAPQALQLARKLKDTSAHACILDYMANSHLALRHTSEALRCFEQSLRLLRGEDRRPGSLADSCQWFPGVLSGNIGRQALERWMRQDEEANGLARQARISYEVACLYIAREELDRASEMLYRSLAFFRRLGDQAGVSRVRSTMLGLGVVACREASADQLTSRDIERGLAREIETKQAH